MKHLVPILCLLILAQTLPAQSLGEFIGSYASDHRFSGTVLVRENGRVLYFKSTGLANRPFRVPNANDTRYKIASITKVFTSVLVMQLYEQGRIGLDNPVSTYFPAYEGPGRDRITIRQLLNHTSGLPYVGPQNKEEAVEKGMADLQMPHSVDEIIRKYYSHPLGNEPGKVFSYSNGEYIILGKIIELMYGKPFEAVLREHILEPLQMNNSGLLFQYRILDNLADSYFTVNDTSGLVNDLPVYIQNWYSAGAMYSTAYDLARFSDALYTGNLLKPGTLKLMVTPGLDDYGFGLWIYDQDKQGQKVRVYKRPGDIMGTRSQLVWLPERKVSVILLANTDETDLDDFVWQIINQL